MPKAIAIAFPVLIGWLAWTLAAALSEGIHPLGRVGVVEKLLFWAPVLGFCLPMAVRCFATGRSLIALWLLALAPAFGLATHVFFVVSATSGTTANPVDIGNAWPFAAVWLAPAAFISIRWCLQHLRFRPRRRP